MSSLQFSAALVCRPSASSQLIPIASCVVDSSSAAGNSSSPFTRHPPSQKDLCAALYSQIRIHFTNHGRFVYDGFTIHYSVVVADPCTLIYVVVSEGGEPDPSAITAQKLMTDIQGALLSEAQLLMLMPQSSENELEPHIQPMLTQFLMTENNQQVGQTQRMQELRAQVEDVKTIMSENVERMMERGDRLENITERSEQLATSSANFKMNARRVQRKFCMLNAKWTIISIIFVLVLVTIAILLILNWAGVFNKK
ncbi:unnamed protein product, partial [Mesorhabditis belari]|uniref:V-SNARE coiled-coil homology domain-containing protein n=1 Tax=Mesorhabditis belari TaxID=2138241 RepID=A0AAF3F0R2_9BILA